MACRYPDSTKVVALVLTALLATSCAYAAPLSTVVHPDWSRSACIYEVNVRQFSPGGTLREFEEHLPRLHEMGVDILWLMPIFPIGELNRKGPLGSYYSVRDYTAVNPEFGTMDDLKSVVGSAHRLGMYVILDWVANHTAWDNPMITEHPDWYTRDSLGNVVSPVPDWHDVADLNYDAPGLREYMTNAMIFWVREADVDGFRCDVSGMVPMEFWVNARRELEKIKPVFMLAEDENPLCHEAAFDMTYSWDLYHLMVRIAEGKNAAADVRAYLATERTNYSVDAYRMRFTSNHDENSWNGTEYERLGEGVKAFAVLAATVPGMPLIYSGQEAGLEKRLKFFERDPIPWQENEMSAIYKALLDLKHRNRALWNGTAGGEMEYVGPAADSSTLAYIRWKDGSQVLVVLNLSGAPRDIVISHHAMEGEYRDVFLGETVTLGKRAQFTLSPWGYRVLEKTR